MVGAGRQLAFDLPHRPATGRDDFLITAQQAPIAWNIALPDLLSRLKAAPAIQLGAPDDVLLRGVLVKLFADRQIGIDEAIVSYLLSRMPRELAAARTLVAEIDRRAFEERAEVTRNFVAKIVGDITSPGLFADEEG